MVIEITGTTLKRLNNYRAVVEREYQDAERQQWRVMTLEVMQSAERARDRSRQISAIVAYARYLHGLQSGQQRRRDIYGEPLLSRALGSLLDELAIERTLVPEQAQVCE